MNLPDEINELYDNVVQYIRSKGNAKMALHWLMCAVRPLKICELSELMDWRQASNSDHRSIRRTFGSLISVSSGAEDDDNASVELAHSTVRDYLSAQRGGNNAFRVGESEAHLTVAYHCLEYLEHFSSESPDGEHPTAADDVSLEKRPLFEYAINNWYKHALASQKKIPIDESSYMAMADDAGKNGQCLTRSLYDMIKLGNHLGKTTSSYIKQLYRAYSGLEATLMNMLAMSSPNGARADIPSNPKEKGSGWQKLKHTNTFARTKREENPTPLCTFSKWSESTKRLLESSHADLTEYRSSVKLAAYRGYELVVDLLLELGASANARTSHHDALTTACTDGYHIMTMVLLGKEVDEKYEDEWWPEECGRQGSNTDGTSIVRSLLLAGADATMSNDAGQTPLHLVAANGKEKIARLLLSRGATTEQQCSGDGVVIKIGRQKLGWRWRCSGTPLHWAVSRSHHDIARMLLDASADVSAKNRFWGQSALQLAARDSDAKMIQLLLDRGADLGDEDYLSIGALRYAAFEGKLPNVKCLLENGADANVRSFDGITPLHMASLQGHKDVVRELLDQAGTDVNAAEERGFTALHLAAQGDHPEVLQMLLQRGAQSVATYAKGSTALMIAAHNGNVKCVKVLLDHSTKIDQRSHSGHTALALAAERGKVEVAGLLLSNNSDLGIRSTRWGTILNAAAYGGNNLVFQACVDKGFNTGEKDRYGRYLIHFAAAGGKVEMISTVLDVAAGYTVHTADSEGRNALHFAAASKSVDAVDMILKHGISHQSEDNDGWTPLHWAARTGNVSVVGFLLKQGRVEGSREWTPERIAAFHGHTNLLPVLQAADSSTTEGHLTQTSKPSERKGYEHTRVRCDSCFLVCLPTHSSNDQALTIRGI